MRFSRLRLHRTLPITEKGLAPKHGCNCEALPKGSCGNLRRLLRRFAPRNDSG
ncbi:hypothetical protein H5T88_04660 [bacterium]|nr:hypothetical protein [bacterium]